MYGVHVLGKSVHEMHNTGYEACNTDECYAMQWEVYAAVPSQQPLVRRRLSGSCQAALYTQEDVCPPPEDSKGPWGMCAMIDAEGDIFLTSTGTCSFCYRSANENGAVAMQWDGGEVVATWYTPMQVACP